MTNSIKNYTYVREPIFVETSTYQTLNYIGRAARIDVNAHIVLNFYLVIVTNGLRRVYSRLQYFFISARFLFVLLTLKSTHVFEKK